MDIDKILELSRASIEKEDLRMILTLVGKISPKYILEIGAWKGYSATNWIDAFNPEKCISLEKESADLFDEVNCISTMNITFWYGCDSHDYEILEAVKKEMSVVDFLFIDGDHSYEGVKQDFEMYFPLVRPGGIVVLHDALYHANGTEEVDIFWNEIKSKHQHMEFKESKNSTGVGVIFKPI